MRGVSINGTRVAGALSLIALLIATYSDLTLTGFWDHNAMATSILADVLVLLVGVAVVNEYLTARSIRSWRLLADYALVDLAQTAAIVWIRLAEAIGLGDRKQLDREQLRQRVLEYAEERRVRRLAIDAASMPNQRMQLHEVVEPQSELAEAALARWAALLSDTPHSQPLTRFVRLQAELGTLALSLREEAKGLRPSFRGTGEPEWIGERVESLIELGVEVERELMALVREGRGSTVPTLRSQGQGA